MSRGRGSLAPPTPLGITAPPPGMLVGKARFLGQGEALRFATGCFARGGGGVRGKPATRIDRYPRERRNAETNSTGRMDRAARRLRRGRARLGRGESALHLRP